VALRRLKFGFSPLLVLTSMMAAEESSDEDEGVILARLPVLLLVRGGREFIDIVEGVE